MDSELPQEFLASEPEIDDDYMEQSENAEGGQAYYAESYENSEEEKDPFQGIQEGNEESGNENLRNQEVENENESDDESDSSDGSDNGNESGSEEESDEEVYENGTDRQVKSDVENGHEDGNTQGGQNDDSDESSGSGENQDRERMEEDDNGVDSDSSSTDETTSSSGSASSHSRVVKNVEYFAKLNLERYLKRRGFNIYHKLPTTIGLDKMVDNMKKAYAGQNQMNAVSYGANYDGEDIISEIQRFWEFYLMVQKEDVSLSSQLKPMLIPLLVYFYQECLLCGIIEFGVKIFVVFTRKFYEESPTKENHMLLSLLANVSCANNFQSDNLKEHPFIKYLQDVEYQFAVNPWVFEKIQKFIQDSKLPVMADLFTHRFAINVQLDDLDTVEELQMESDNTEKVEEDKDVKSEIHTVIANLRASLLPNLPSILVYTTNGKSVCGAISKHGSMIAYGMENTGMRIFEAPLVQGGMRSYVKIPAEEIGPDHSVKLLSGHDGLVNDLAFHPRAKYLFSVGEDAIMRIWDVHNNICRAIYRGHHSPIWSLDISGSGNMIVTGSMDTTARVWVPERTEYVRLLVGHYFDVDCVKFHPNEAYVATGSVDKTVRLWSVADGNLVRMFTGSKGAITSMAFQKNGKLIAAAGEDNVIRIWDIGEGKVVAQLEGPSNCRDLCFYNDMLAAAYSNNTIRIWNLQDLLNSPSLTVGQVDEIADIDSKTFPSKTESIVKLHYKNPAKLYCLGSSRNIVQTSSK